MDKINVCCPFLDVADCEDSTEHCHLFCGTNGDFMDKDMVTKYCIDDWTKCGHFKAYPMTIPFVE